MKWLVLSLSLAAAPPTIGPDQLLIAGETYVQGGQYKKAAPVLQRALDSGKLSTEQQARAYTALGMAKTAAGDHDAAIKHFEQAIALSPGDERPYLWLGMTYDTSERFQEARGVYERGVQRFPKSANLLRELGATELLLGDAHSAVEHLGAALKKMSDDPEVMRDYGEALLVSGKAQHAVKVLQDARELDDQNAHIAATLGDALAASGETDKALEMYEEAVTLDRAHAPAWFHKGLLHAKKGDLPAAIAAYRQSLKVDPANLKARMSLGVALSRAGGQDALAIKLLRQVVDKDPSYAEAHAQLALALEKQGDLPGAEASFTQAIARRNDDPRLYEELARIQEKRGRKKEAAQTLKSAQKYRRAGGAK